MIAKADLDHVIRNVSAWNALREARVLITGSTGFIGRWMMGTLEAANRELSLGVRIVGMNPTVIIHASNGPIMDQAKALLPMMNNAPLLLFLSSGAVNGGRQIHAEYGREKREAETLLAGHATCGVKIARGFTFIGPHLRSRFAASQFIADAVAGRDVTVRGNPDTVRSYLYAADMAVWLWAILLSGTDGLPYDVGSFTPITIETLAHSVAKAAGVGVVFKETAQMADEYLPKRSNNLGLQQLIQLDDAIERTLNFYLTTPPSH